MCEKSDPVSFKGMYQLSDVGPMMDVSAAGQFSSVVRPLEERVQQVSQPSLAPSSGFLSDDLPPSEKEALQRRMNSQLASKSVPLENISSLRSQYQAASLCDVEVLSVFQNIPCPRTTAVAVGKKYLHANYVTDGKTPRTFVASQLPYEKQLFWKFILENDFDIIDLHTLDSGYAPSEQTGQLRFDSIIVQFVKKIDECTFEYEVYDSVSQMKRQVRRHHFTGWRDTYSVTVAKLQELVSLLETTFTRNTLVHCHAGIGRTGTLIAAYFTKQQIRSGIIRHENLEMALVDLIVELRKQRGSHFVQNAEQFGLLVDFALVLLHS
jgi:protein tyrosine phosphatase